MDQLHGSAGRTIGVKFRLESIRCKHADSFIQDKKMSGLTSYISKQRELGFTITPQALILKWYILTSIMNA